LIRQFLKVVNSTAGFSLIEVMIGASILAGIGLTSAHLFKESRQAQKRIEFDQQLETYHQTLAKNMNNPANCNATLKQYVPSGSAITSQNINTLYRCTSGCLDNNATADLSFDAYTPGAYGGTPMIAVTNYTDASNIWRVDQINMSGRNNSGNIFFKINYTLNPRIPGSRTISRDIVVNTRFSGGQFKECVNSQESSINNLQNDLCKSLNLSEAIVASDGRMARWDDATQTCIVDGSKDCSTTPGMQVDGIGTDGIVRCKPIVNNTDAAALQNPAVVTCAPTERTQAYFDTATKTLRIRCLP
jgi:Tfp pilus assembly protein PilV